MALYFSEKRVLRKLDQKYLKCFEIWLWRRTVNICWTDHVRNEEILQRVKEKRNWLQTVKRMKPSWVDLPCVVTAFQTTLLKERWKEG